MRNLANSFVPPVQSALDKSDLTLARASASPAIAGITGVLRANARPDGQTDGPSDWADRGGDPKVQQDIYSALRVKHADKDRLPVLFSDFLNGGLEGPNRALISAINGASLETAGKCESTFNQVTSVYLKLQSSKAEALQVGYSDYRSRMPAEVAATVPEMFVELVPKLSPALRKAIEGCRGVVSRETHELVQSVAAEIHKSATEHRSNTFQKAYYALLANSSPDVAEQLPREFDKCLKLLSVELRTDIEQCWATKPDKIVALMDRVETELAGNLERAAQQTAALKDFEGKVRRRFL